MSISTPDPSATTDGLPASEGSSSTHNWLEGCEPQEWLLEEYKLLSAHYFHEDALIWRTITMFATFNGALLAFLGSTFATSRLIASWLVPIVGIALSVSWFMSLIRTRAVRGYAQRRMRMIENVVRQSWAHEGFAPLDIMSQAQWREHVQHTYPHWFAWALRRGASFPASRTFLFLPMVFAVIWIIVLWP
jgi:hypothetical protein